MAKYYIIYETKNLVDGKIYIGMHETTNLNDGYLGSGKRLKRAIRYYGKEFFERKILFTFNNRENMIAKEVELVTESFVKRKDTYNLKTGGEGGIVNEEHKQKFIKSGLKGNITFKNRLKNDIDFLNKFKEFNKKRQDAGTKSPINTRFKGLKHKKSTKKKISDRAKLRVGNKNSQFNTMWITNGIKNIKISKDDFVQVDWKKGRKIKI